MNYRFRVAYYRVIDTITYSRTATWLLSLTFRSPLYSPYFPPQVMLARYCANLATILWALIVLGQQDALVRSNTTYGWITAYAGENWIAAVLLAVAVVQTIGLIVAARPRWHWPCGYGLLAFFWAFVALSMYFNVQTIFPTGGSVAPVIFGLAFYGFVSIPKRRVDAVA